MEKIGNAGVSICCLDDAKKLYSGFDLGTCINFGKYDYWTSTYVAWFLMNAAIDQQ
jgi:methylmalonyl-CoA mutase